MGLFNFKSKVSSQPTVVSSEAVNEVINSAGNTQQIAISEPTPAKKLPFGGNPHVLTPEERAKGQETRRKKKEMKEMLATHGLSWAEALVILEDASKLRKDREQEAKRAASEKRIAALPVNHETGSKFYRNKIREKFNYYTRIMSTSFDELATVECDPNVFAANLAKQLTGLVTIPAPMEGVQWAIVLKHRKSGTFVTIGNNGVALQVATSGKVTPELLQDINLLSDLVG